MKGLILVSLSLVLVVTAVGQTPSSAPGVEVTKNNWHMVERNLKLDQDPLAINDQVAARQNAIKDTIVENQANAKANQSLRQIPTGVSSGPPSPKGFQTWYDYEITIKNTGSKTIRKLVWKYAFSDPALQSQVPLRQYQKKTKISPGKTRNLAVRGAGRPVGVVDARKVGTTPGDNSPEQVIITRVEYADGSVWTRPTP